MKSIAEHNKKTLGEKINLYITSAWYFESAFDKAFLILIGFLAVWRVLSWIF